MISNRLALWIRDRKAEFRQVTAAKSEPSPTSSPEWFTGLVVSPASFSQQLGDMQLSLMRANDEHANESLADEPRADELAQQTHGHAQMGDEVAVSQQRS